jgi:hypothetical protein
MERPVADDPPAPALAGLTPAQQARVALIRRLWAPLQAGPMGPIRDVQTLLAIVDAQAQEIGRLRDVEAEYQTLVRMQGEQIHAQAARLAAVEQAIRRVLDDAESRPGAWGPDVTCVAILRAALEG